jgi:hypothetical protein
MNGNQDRLPALLGGVYGAKDIASRATAAKKEMPALLQDIGAAKEEGAISEFRAGQGVKERTAAAERQFADKSREAATELESGVKPYQEFQQPEYKASDYAANAAARLFTGLMIGGVAKTSAIGQLKAVRDMQKAEDQGLREQFTAAKIKFDEAEKARKDFNDDLKQRFDRMIKLLSSDRAAALAEGKIIEASLGEGAIRANIRAGNLQKAFDQFNKFVDANDKLQIARETARIRAENRQGGAGQLIMGTDAQGNQVPMLLDPRTGQIKKVTLPEGVTGGVTRPGTKAPTVASEKQKPTAQITNEFSRTKDSIDDVADVLEKINNPKVREEWGKANQIFGRYLAEVSGSQAQGDSILRKYVAGEAIKGLSPEVRDLFVSIATARNNYYKLQSGTAVSGAEAARNFGAVIQPTDDLDTLRTKAYQVANRSMKKINDDLSAYQFAPKLEESIQKRLGYLKGLTKVVEINGKLYKQLDDGTYEQMEQANQPEKK